MISPLTVWPAFRKLVRRRLGAGAREYRDCSPSRSLPDLATEIVEELADVAGWAAVAFARVEALRGKLMALETEANGASEGFTLQLTPDELRVLHGLSTRLGKSPAETLRIALVLLGDHVFGTLETCGRVRTTIVVERSP